MKETLSENLKSQLKLIKDLQRENLLLVKEVRKLNCAIKREKQLSVKSLEGWLNKKLNEEKDRAARDRIISTKALLDSWRKSK